MAKLYGAILLLTIVLCVQWTDALSCAPCDKSKCKDPGPCPYGKEKDVCGCCDRCKKGPGYPCKGLFNIAGSCGGKMVCIGSTLNSPGICLDNVKCFRAEKCDGKRKYEISSGGPRRTGKCKYGFGRNNCSCYPKCLKGVGESCGIRMPGRIPCGKGMRCLGETKCKKGRCVKVRPPLVPKCVHKQDCRRVRCASPPKNCKHGRAVKSPCGCCYRCPKGEGEKCGVRHSRYVQCGIGLRCLRERVYKGYHPGKCYGTCPFTIKCPDYWWKRAPPKGCTYGFSKPRCGCCKVCNKGNNQVCGYKVGNCRDGYYCRGQRIRKRKGKITFKNGRCRKRGGCPYFVRCRKRSCPKIHCKFGTFKPRCACCPLCVKTNNQECGMKHGKCRKGYYCRGARNREVNGMPIFKPGRCRKIGGCPYFIRCNRKRCPKCHCKYGSAKPKCGCCKVCLKGINEKCGMKLGDCRKGYYCRGYRSREINGKPVFTPGRCRKRGGCPYYTRCKGVRCLGTKRCKHGSAKPLCACCPACIKGLNEKCGIRHGKCLKGFYCRGSRVKEVNGIPIYTPGKCVKRRRRRCPYLLRCNRRMCPRLKCRYGISKPLCACCPMCKKSLNGKCGIHHGTCKSGLVCKGDSVKVVKRWPQFTAGKCVRSTTKRCPILFACAAIYKPPPKNCRYGYSKPLCGCFNLCNKDSGQKCGYQIGNCRSGFICKGMRYVKKGKSMKYINGICTRKRRKCPKIFACPLIYKAPPKNCRYGYSRPICGCFSICNKDSGQICGYQIGNCRSGFICKGMRYVKKGKSIKFIKGVCTRRRRKCPKIFACPLIYKAPPKNCRYGYSRPICGCFSICNKSSGQRCGYKTGNCRSGFICRGMRFIRRGKSLKFIDGICTSKNIRPGGCPYPIVCPVYIRQPDPPTGCRYGYSKPLCGCLPVCNRGRNGRCGYQTANCRAGYKCIGRRIRRINGKNVYIPGRCRRSRKVRRCMYPIRCPAVIRPPPKGCRFGYSKALCTCFPKCRRDAFQSCGFNTAECRRGFFCKGQRACKKNGRIQFTSGICIPIGGIMVPSAPHRPHRPILPGGNQPMIPDITIRELPSVELPVLPGGNQPVFPGANQPMPPSVNRPMIPGFTLPANLAKLRRIFRPIGMPYRPIAYPPVFHHPMPYPIYNPMPFPYGMMGCTQNPFAPITPYNYNLYRVNSGRMGAIVLPSESAASSSHRSHRPIFPGGNQPMIPDITIPELPSVELPVLPGGNQPVPPGVNQPMIPGFTPPVNRVPGPQWKFLPRTPYNCNLYRLKTGRPPFCPNCAAVSCLRVTNCRFGIGKDPCGCCPVCLKGPGQNCGGPYNKYGKCGRGYYCRTMLPGFVGTCVCRN